MAAKAEVSSRLRKTNRLSVWMNPTGVIRRCFMLMECAHISEKQGCHVFPLTLKGQPGKGHIHSPLSGPAFVLSVNATVV